jgi:hypothetical protein
MLAKARATFPTSEIFTDHLFVLDDLSRMNQNLLVQALRKAREMARSIAASDGYVIHNGRISPAPYDPLLDDDIEDYFEYEMDRLRKDLP